MVGENRLGRSLGMSGLSAAFVIMAASNVWLIARRAPSGFWVLAVLMALQCLAAAWAVWRRRPIGFALGLGGALSLQLIRTAVTEPLGDARPFGVDGGYCRLGGPNGHRPLSSLDGAWTSWQEAGGLIVKPDGHDFYPRVRIARVDHAAPTGCRKGLLLAMGPSGGFNRAGHVQSNVSRLWIFARGRVFETLRTGLAASRNCCGLNRCGHLLQRLDLVVGSCRQLAADLIGCNDSDVYASRGALGQADGGRMPAFVRCLHSALVGDDFQQTTRQALFKRFISRAFSFWDLIGLHSAYNAA